MDIIITGASGFVGQNLALYLSNSGISISNLSLRSSDWYSYIENKACAIVHLAGKAHDTSNTSSDEEYFRVNRDLTIKLYDFFLQSDIKDFFYFSSVKAVADSISSDLMEDAIPNPLTPYGKSKIEAEKYLLTKPLPPGKRLFIIRPCMIHGPKNKGNLNLLYKVVEKGIPWPLASFHNERSFLSVDNLSFLIQAMLEKSDLASGIYNFADDETLSTNQLVSLVSETLGKKPKLWHISEKFIRYIVKLGDFIPLPLNSERLKKLTESYVVSNAKIKDALAIQHLPLSAKEGLTKTILSFKK